MSRIRIIIPAATIEQTKLFLIRGAFLLLCVLIFPLAAHASPFDSGIGGVIVFIGGCIFGHWVTNSDPAFLKILGRSEKFKLRYDAAKQRVPNVEVR
jgi:hypothetical protein